MSYLQPFDDVNKRVSRLAANIPLAHHGLAPLSFIDVPDDIYIYGMIGVYERSAARYVALRQSLGEPDPFRLKYRDIIRELIADIILNMLKLKEASVMIKAKELPPQDQEKFIESVETKLLSLHVSLHEGNFARYRIRPSEFKKWKARWD